MAYWLAREEPAPPPGVAASIAPVPAPLPQKASIAVLPFDNMSGDDAKVYFSDGISEEILNDLANVRALRVAARASSFSFKGKNTDIKTIARMLAVRTVLQGSVRQSGERIRITAQLVNASDGYVIWSSSFDRDLTDVLTVQDEIARAITASLTDRLLPHQLPKPKPRLAAINADAYRAYLQGQYYLLGPRTPEGAVKALALFPARHGATAGFCGSLRGAGPDLHQRLGGQTAGQDADPRGADGIGARAGTGARQSQRARHASGSVAASSGLGERDVRCAAHAEDQPRQRRRAA